MAHSPRQLGLEFRTWGGARAGAGRKPSGARPGVSHLRRPAHSRHHPLHVTLRVQRGVSSLRGPALFRIVRKALAAAKQQFGFSLVHFSVQSDHLHLIAEARDRRALARGVQGLSIRVARAVNRQLERKGRLFADRYHARALKTPREVKFALRYVLLNARKHAAASRQTRTQERRAGEGIAAGFVDSCSSAAWFRCFRRPEGLAFGAQVVRAEWLRTSGSTDPPVARASVWLLSVGQRTAGFDVDDVPGAGANMGVGGWGGSMGGCQG